MFDQLKKIQELKKMQDSFKEEHETAEKRGVMVIMNGTMEVERITLNPTLDVREQEQILKQCFNEAKEKIQKKLAKKMMSSGLGAGLGL
jgi:DNA-binding protein YbaB